MSRIFLIWSRLNMFSPKPIIEAIFNILRHWQQQWNSQNAKKQNECPDTLVHQTHWTCLWSTVQLVIVFPLKHHLLAHNMLIFDWAVAKVSWFPSLSSMQELSHHLFLCVSQFFSIFLIVPWSSALMFLFLYFCSWLFLDVPLFQLSHHQLCCFFRIWCHCIFSIHSDIHPYFRYQTAENKNRTMFKKMFKVRISFCWKWVVDWSVGKFFMVMGWQCFLMTMD